ncbi:chitobiase/beta-hexosaminidase C-terminal domain-containing protein [Occallatibacter riparius]|uniref:Chitobiase/beta-hexosaminidase C-terminal domain-containing protein n=1 Tax=Occallatibacter riparius TaxID=1002689 RepID=A0A9J7BPM5_9BACT|nr:chitobiase/beta-hexosaminidase C-terminal domain-containing protein [Occallatibacter riparius]UWZ84836.1 chitobiase/beta-hexosaminidase C-terminal domain-containing protein [Occallatibacter riparius]
MSASTGSGDWVWQKGSNEFNINPVFGTLRVSSPAANPGSRSGMASWTDNSGNLWIFGGGVGYSDVWEFNSSTMEWAWMAGPNTPSQAAVYGTLGVAAPANVPGLRSGSATWKDKDGNFWLFGGEGQDSAGNYGYLNDLWKFDTTTFEWTWMGGSNVLPTCPSTNSCGPPGVYGTLGTSSASNVPGGRSDALGWTDASGNFWMFGGRIYIVYLNGWGGYENDLWKYSPSTHEWTWMGGNSSLPSDCTLNDSCGYAGIYGTLLTPSSSNLPGAREESTVWTDSNGNFWLFGGFGYGSNHIRGELNDLWKFAPSTGEWEWVSGSDTIGTRTYGGQAGVYGTKGVSSSANHPGGRNSAAGWMDQDDNLWLFGGYGFGSTNADWAFSSGFLNDLWRFNPATDEWTWMTGSDLIGGLASFGTLGVGSSNDPGNRIGVAAWSGPSGNLWFFGGSYRIDNYQSGAMSDVWEYLIDGADRAAPPTFSPPAGTYTSALSVKLRSVTPGVTIYYTTDGSTPTVSATVYNGPITVTQSQTISAIAAGSGYLQSSAVSASYVINLPVAATPTFSVPTGTYTSAQTVTISDVTPGATVYYTTDGSAPGTNSARYTNPVSVSQTETLKAIATASGYAPSLTASATYTISAASAPPSFTFSASPSTITVMSGGTGTTTLTVTPQNGFSSAVSFSCSGLPSGTACTFSPGTIKPSGAPVTSQLGIAARAVASNGPMERTPLLPGAAVAGAGALLFWRKRRPCTFWIPALLLSFGLVLLTACSSFTVKSRTTTVTVSAKAGRLQQTAQVTLTVNP